MANREVNLTKRVQTLQGMQYRRVVLSANGRVKPDLVVVNGKPESHKEYAYHLEGREGAKRVRFSVGKDPSDATARRLRKEAGLNAVKERRLSRAWWPERAPASNRWVCEYRRCAVVAELASRLSQCRRS